MPTWTFHVLKAWNDRKSIVRIKCSKCWRFDTIRLESNDSLQQMTIRHTGCQFAEEDNIFEVSCKSASGMTGRHLLCRVVRFESIRVDATTFSTPMRNIFLSLLQIDFWYAFPCHKRWFLRPPVSQHHLAANRLPVWRFVNCLWWFAAVWVYWTTLRNTIYIPNS